MALGYITNPKDYWIAGNALYISLNANDDPDYIVGNASAGAQILCYVKGIEGLEYDNGHNYHRWTLSLSPTFFRTENEKYVYVAIPRPSNPLPTAVVVFPSEQLDIYGQNENGEQIGSAEYYYIFLQGIITATNAGRTLDRDWAEGHRIDTGTLSSDEAFSPEKTDWYRYSSIDDTVTFLKEMIMSATSWFSNLRLGSASNNLTGVAKSTTGYTDSDTLVATPGYVDSQFLSKTHEDAAQEQIGFLEGLWIKAKGMFGIDKDGNVKGNDGFFGGLLTAYRAVMNVIASSNYTGSSMSDTGWQLTNDNGAGRSSLTIDELYVRHRAIFEELIVKKKEVTGGDQIFSCAANVISRTDFLDANGNILGYKTTKIPLKIGRVARFINSLLHHQVIATSKRVRNATLSPEELEAVTKARCYFLAEDGDRQIDNWWQVGDLALCQTLDLERSSRQDYIGTSTHVGNVRWWRKVVAVSSSTVTIDEKKYHYFDVEYHPEAESEAISDTSWCEQGSDVPAAGDHVSQLGNVSNSNRMNAIMLEVNGEGDSNNAAIKIVYGIYTFSMAKCYFGGPAERMKLSPRDGYTFYGPSFRFQTQYDVVPAVIDRGQWLDIELERDDMSPHGNVRKCYYYDRVSHNGSLWLCKVMDNAYWVKNEGTAADPIWNVHAAPTANDDMTLFERRRSYTIDEPSESSSNWEKQVSMGEQGANADEQISAFRWYSEELTPVKPTDVTSDEPAPASSDHTGSSKVYPTTKWSKTAPNRPADGWCLWMVQTTKHTDGSGTVTRDAWSTPVRISGEKGSAGEDAKDIEYIYTLRETETVFSGSTGSNALPKNISTGTVPDTDTTSPTYGQRIASTDKTADDFVPDGWYDNPLGISATNKFEYISFRIKPRGNNQTWGDFSAPIMWSHYGRNGIDGDGVEYVFIRTKDTTAPVVPATGTYSEEAQGYDSDEHLPYVCVPEGKDLSGSTATVTSGGYKYAKCTDDPVGTSGVWQYEWVLKRTKGSADAVTGIRAWEAYGGTMALWGRWAKDGDNITKQSETYRYAVSTQNTTPPTEAGDESATAVLDRWYGTRAKVSSIYTTGRYLWTEITITWSDSSTTVMYSSEYYPNNGEAGYSFQVTPASIIINQNINNVSDFGLPLYLTSSVMQGSTPVSHQVEIQSYSVAYAYRDNSLYATSHTLTLSSLQDSTGEATRGYINVRLYVSSTNYRDINIPVYINRIGTWKASIENGISTEVGNQITYGLQDGGVIKNAYDAAITKSATGLTQQFTEMVSHSDGAGANMFGFHKGVMFTTTSALLCVPFIQGYGLVALGTNNSVRCGRIYELGTNGVGGYFVATFQIRTTVSGGKVYVNMCDVSGTLGEGSLSSSSPYISVGTSWATYEIHFYIPADNSYISADGYNGFLDFEEVADSGYTKVITNNGAPIYVRHLKVERGTVATDFCEADEDIAYLGQRQLVGNPTFNKQNSNDQYPMSYDGRENVYRIYASWLSGSTTLIDYIYKNSAVNIEAGKCYTLSFWARASVNGLIITHHLYKSGYSLINDIDREIYAPSGNGYSYEGVVADGGTYTKLTNSWQQYFVHFYAKNAIAAANLIALRVEKAKNTSVSTCYIYMSDILFQEGYALSESYFSSLLTQNARRISLVQQSGTKLAGINIQDGEVNVQAEHFTISKDGNQVFGVDTETGLTTMQDIVVQNAEIKGSLMYDKLAVHKTENYIDNFVFWNASGNQVTLDTAEQVTKCTTPFNIIIPSGSKRTSAYSLHGTTGITGYTVILPPARFVQGMRIKIINSTYLGGDGVRASDNPSPINLAVIYRADTEEYEDDAWGYVPNMIAAVCPTSFLTSGSVGFTLVGQPDGNKCTDFTPSSANYYTIYGLKGDTETLYKRIEMVAAKNPYAASYATSTPDYAWLIIDAEEA